MSDILSIDGVKLEAPRGGKLLPPGAFTSRGVFEAEMECIFEHAWVHVADRAELEKAGDYVAAEIGRVPVVLLRGEDGALRGFLNACRHRGATVAEGQGNCGRQLRCPYHAWSYDTTGRLVGVPYREEFSHCDLSSMGLTPIRVATLGPWVFGCIDADAPGFDSWVGELGDAMKRACGDEMRPAFQFDYEVACNWKIYVENAMDGYHVPFVHDMLDDLVGQSDDAEHFFEKYGSYTHAAINPAFIGMIPTPPHLSAEDLGRVRFGHVFPNLIPVITPTDVSYLRIDPVDHERIRLRGRSFDLEGPARMIADFRRDSFDRTNRQDMAIVQRVQRGLRANDRAGLVHADKLEARIPHFESMLVRELASRHKTRLALAS